MICNMTLISLTIPPKKELRLKKNRSLRLYSNRDLKLPEYILRNERVRPQKKDKGGLI